MSGIAHKNKFFLGLGLFLAFWVVFIIGMSPVFGGKNMLNLTDDLFNSVSKSSSYYIPEAREEAESVAGEEMSFTTKGKDDGQTDRIKKLMEKNGVKVSANDKSLKVQADLGILLEHAVVDSDTMFANDGKAVAAKYGYDERHVMNDWWTALDAGQKDLTKNNNFDAAKVIMEVNEKAVEPAYNYYGINAESPRIEAPLVALSLIGYIIYTVWYGFSLLFMFEGWGLKLEH